MNSVSMVMYGSWRSRAITVSSSLVVLISVMIGNGVAAGLGSTAG